MTAGGTEPGADPGREGERARGTGGGLPGRLEELAELLRGALGDLREARERTVRLARIQADRARLGLREGAFYAAVALLGGVVLLAVLATSGALLVLGFAGAAGALFDSAWAGALAASVTLLLALAGALLLIRRKLQRSASEKLAAKYERPAREQPVEGSER